VSGVLVVAHHERPEAADLARQARAWLGDRGLDAWMVPEDARALGVGALASERPVTDADLALSLGGDGTTLRAVDLVSAAGVPVLGVNVGLLGYLNETEPPAMLEALEGFLAGRHTIEERMMLDVTVRRTGAPGAPAVEEPPVRALNEVVLERDEPGHTIRIRLRIDGAGFIAYAADGLIVATPTGSTAYSLSARGPIVSPGHRALLVTPVSPHMLFDRSLLLDPTETVDLELIGHRRAVLSVDGRRGAVLDEGDVVVCRASDVPARLVRFPGARPFHQILKSKFGLTDR
jgi:NAD+ kinase